MNFRDAVAIFGMDLDDLIDYRLRRRGRGMGFGDVDDEDGDAQKCLRRRGRYANGTIRRCSSATTLRRRMTGCAAWTCRNGDEHRMDRNEVQDEERVYEAQFIAKHILARRYQKKPSYSRSTIPKS